jgi:hypothetical protein
MGTLTQEQQSLLRQSGGKPVRLYDPDTDQQYVLVLADVFDRLQMLSDEVNPREMYPALHRAMSDEGWDDPQMDEYNRYG